MFTVLGLWDGVERKRVTSPSSRLLAALNISKLPSWQYLGMYFLWPFFPLVGSSRKLNPNKVELFGTCLIVNLLKVEYISVRTGEWPLVIKAQFISSVVDNPMKKEHHKHHKCVTFRLCFIPWHSWISYLYLLPPGFFPLLSIIIHLGFLFSFHCALPIPLIASLCGKNFAIAML